MTTPVGDDPDRTELLATRGPIADDADAADGESLAPGARLGRYRIEALLGRGGMGDVYRAEQLEPVRRTVALKLLRRRRLDARHLAYFEVERQLLAQMRHPAIAQVFDADTTAQGYPFFAMEFIAGSPLTRFCEEHALSLRQRIELMIRVCEGVQHAHQKGVVHRDLKPGNLLVDEVDGRALPKIIDFGIATASSMVEGREIAGTPDYMSPEQAAGDQALVDTRSDVYSLGVVLYEVLTGRRPEIAGETHVASTRTLRLPSEQLATLPPGDAGRIARANGLRLADMRRVLRHELDWVVARAMRHDRSERYPSAGALADDLRRFLDGAPLSAVPASRGYVWGKFVRRHRVGLAAASIALAALLGGLAMSLYGLQQARTQRAIAQQRSAELEKVAAFQQSMLEGIDIEAMGIGMARGLRGQAAKAEPATRAAVEDTLAHASTADIARNLIDRNILAGAETAIARDFAREPGLAADLRESVARVRDALGLPEAAAAGFGKVADYREQALGASAVPTLDARRQQATAMLSAQQPKPALALLQRTLSDAASLPPDDPLRIRLEMAQAEAVGSLGDREAARKALQSLYARSRKAHGERGPITMEAMNNLAILLGRMGEAKLGRDYMERLVPMRRAVLGADHEDTLGSLHNLAVMRIMTGDSDGALVLQRQLVETQTRRLGAEHPKTLTERGNLASMLVDSGKANEALPISLSVVEACTRVLGADSPQTLRAKLNLSTLYARLGQFDRTLTMQQEVVDARTRLLGPRHPDTIYIRVNRAGSLLQAGRAKESLALLDSLLPLTREVLGGRHPQTQSAYDIRAQAAEAVGDTTLAIASYREALALRAAALGAGDLKTIDTAWKLEGLLAAVGEVGEAGRIRARYVTPLLEKPDAQLDDRQRTFVAKIRRTEAEEAAQAAKKVAER
jgi:non-specific serine/threonine protein kinase/serine/threonine-protein kinase